MLWRFVKELKELVIYGLKYCSSKGLKQAARDFYPHFRYLLLKAFFDGTKVQLLAGKSRREMKQEHRPGLAVLFITVPEVASMLYRCVNQSEQLALNGIRSKIVTAWDISLMNYIYDYDVFIFHRVPYSAIAGKMVGKIAQSGKIAIYDIDDLAFELDLLKHPTPISRRLVSGFAAMMMRFDYALVTTEFLAELLRKKGKKAFVNRNCLNLEQIEIAEEAIKHRRKSSRVRVGYFSGTPTHDHDFLEVTDALLRVMERHDSVDLYIAGPLKLGPEFNKFNRRIRRIPFVHWRKLPFNIAKVDINLAPLEKDTPFSEGKSELKYFEAGILGIPTIASPTGAFRFAIKHAENGLLAGNKEEWIECLELLICDKRERTRMGKRAMEHVRANYNPYYRGRQLANILQQATGGSDLFVSEL